jgi:hypothetical protein
MPWWVIAITVVLWIFGILSARKRGISRTAQVLFSIGMLGGALGDFLFHQAVIPITQTTAKVGLGVWLGVLAISAVLFLTLRLYVQYALFATGISLIFFSFFASLLFFTPFFVIGLLLILASLLFGFRRRKRQVAQGASGPAIKG